MSCLLRIFDCCITQPQTLYEIAREQEEGGYLSSAKANYLKIIENGITTYKKRRREEMGPSYLAYQAPPELDRIQESEEAKNYHDIMFMLNDEERLRGRMREAVFRLGVVLYKESSREFEKSRPSYEYINESAANKYLRKMDVARSYIVQAARVGLEEASEYFPQIDAAREKLVNAKEKRERADRQLRGYADQARREMEAKQDQFLAEAGKKAEAGYAAERARQAERTRLIEEHPEIPHLERIHRDLQDLQSRVTYYGSKGKW